MDDLHEMTGWLAHASPHPGLAADQPSGPKDLDARNRALVTPKEKVHGTKQSGHARAGPGRAAHRGCPGQNKSRARQGNHGGSRFSTVTRRRFCHVPAPEGSGWTVPPTPVTTLALRPAVLIAICGTVQPDPDKRARYCGNAEEPGVLTQGHLLCASRHPALGIAVRAMGSLKPAPGARKES
jgi:hypothetical protein